MQSYNYKSGNSPLIISIPHAGTYVPDEILNRMTPEARSLPDTDWHVDTLYDFANDLGATVIKGNYSRYVIDLNRPPDDAPLYPGMDTTGLCPTTLFSNQPIYLLGQEPDQKERLKRVEKVWAPYHQRLNESISEKVMEYGYALLYEAHSIRSHIPRLFEGRLPDLNLGSADGTSADSNLQDQLAEICQQAPDYTYTVNGRFKGGYITRYYGQPENGIHAVQLELTQCSYMNESYPFEYQPEKAAKIQDVLRQLINCLLEWRPHA